jgi:hypothetical protein
VARGEGDGWRSFSFPVPSFSAVRDALRRCGAGEADFRVTTGRGRRREGGEREVEGGGLFVVVLEVEGVTAGHVVDIVGVDLEDEAAVVEDDAVGDDEGSEGAGSLNSTGLTRGVACTLVINLARLQ